MMSFDWTKIPTGRNYLYYGREEMDAFHELIKGHIEQQDRLYKAAIDLLAKTREEVKEQRSIVHHLDTVLDEAQEWLNDISFRFGLKRKSIRLQRMDWRALKDVMERREIEEGRQN